MVAAYRVATWQQVYKPQHAEGSHKAGYERKRHKWDKQTRMKLWGNGQGLRLLS
jgi:hypothetical protein